MPELAIDDLTEIIIGCAIAVHSEIGPGLLESIYRDCLRIELEEREQRVQVEKQVPVFYHGQRVRNDLQIDLLVENRVVVEIKAAERLHPVHQAQVITYLKLTGCPAGLLFNFNATSIRAGMKRVDHPTFSRRSRKIASASERNEARGAEDYVPPVLLSPPAIRDRRRKWGRIAAGGFIRMRRCLALAAAVAATSFVAAQSSPLAGLKTTAESSEFKSTSTYDEVVKFMKAVDDASPIVFYTTYGTTTEGRAMPMAVVGKGLKDASPAAVKASGKLRVHIQGNVHAGEVEGKESAQILLRELALGQHAAWLDSMVFLITPIYNADGNEKFALTNRQRQNGPINGMGTRANAKNLNINRDYMKLDTPEAQAFVKLMNDYDPHVSYDLHTSDGSYHGYYLTYSPPLNPDTDPAIMKIMTDEWFPYVTKDMKAKHGWDSFYYGNVSTPGGRGAGRGPVPPAAPSPAAPSPAATATQPPPPAAAGQTPPPAVPGGGRGAGRGQGAACGNMPAPEGITRAWATFEHTPRFHNNYVGLRNRFALLSEAYAYATFEDRIKATNYFLDASLDFANRNAAKLKKAIADADRLKIGGKPLATTSKFKTGGTVDILMGEVEPETNPLNQAVMCRRKDVTKVEKMTDMMWFEPATTETVPSAYYVPSTATKAIELLKAHGVQMKQTAVAGPIEAFTIKSNNAGQNFEGHAMRTVDGAWGALPKISGDAKYLEIRTDQPLGRLAFYLLEPTSDDGLVAWNYLDEQLKDATLYPILRRK